MTPGPLQIILIIAVVVLLFGANRLPRIMGDVAKGIRSFKSGLSDTSSNAPDSVADTSTTKTESSEDKT